MRKFKLLFALAFLILTLVVYAEQQGEKGCYDCGDYTNCLVATPFPQGWEYCDINMDKLGTPEGCKVSGNYIVCPWA